MRRSIRRALFWLLFCLFAVTAPVAILYSQGYRFDMNRMIFVHSGSVTVKADPSNASIYLNGELQETKKLDIINNSVTLSGLRPGNYSLRVGAEGYQSWEKEVEVHSGLSSEYWNVILTSSSPAAKGLESGNVARFFPSPFGKKIAYAQNLENGLSVWVNTVSQNTSKPVADDREASYRNSKSENIEWNFKEDLMTIPVSRQGRGDDYLVASSEADMQPFFLSDVKNVSAPEKTRWSPKDKNVLYFLAADGKSSDGTFGLYTMDIGTKVPKKVLDGIAAYDISPDYIYFLKNNNVLFRSNLHGDNQEQITTSTFSDGSLGSASRLIVYDKDRQALLAGNGDLIIHNKGETAEIFQKIGEGIEGMQFSDDGKKLLFWSNNEISVRFLRKWETQPFRNENDSETVIRLSTPLSNVLWYQDYEHVLFSTKNKTKLIELDSRDQRNCAEVLESNMENFPAAYDMSAGLYYFLKEDNGEGKIYYIETPVSKGIFG